MSRNSKGQFVIGIGIAVSILITVVGGASAFFVGQGRQDSEIAVVRNEQANLKDDVSEIKSDVKEILRALNESK